MSIQIKTAEEIEKMRRAGRLAAELLMYISPYVQAGVTTNQLDRLCVDYIQQHGALSACLGFGTPPFPKSICTSVNHVVCHGIPNDKPLKHGDIINIDVTVKKDGYHGDTSKMFTIGKPSLLADRLIRVTQECLYLGIDLVKPGVYLGDIGHAIQNHAEKHHYSVVREYGGHGIGHLFHEPDSSVLHFGKPGVGEMLKVGMIFTIEPMINAGRCDIRLLGDSWTVVTKDRQLSAQWEHTILVTPIGCEVLTQRSEEVLS